MRDGEQGEGHGGQERGRQAPQLGHEAAQDRADRHHPEGQGAPGAADASEQRAGDDPLAQRLRDHVADRVQRADHREAHQQRGEPGQHDRQEQQERVHGEREHDGADLPEGVLDALREEGAADGADGEAQHHEGELGRGEAEVGGGAHRPEDEHGHVPGRGRVQHGRVDREWAQHRVPPQEDQALADLGARGRHAGGGGGSGGGCAVGHLLVGMPVGASEADEEHESPERGEGARRPQAPGGTDYQQRGGEWRAEEAVRDLLDRDHATVRRRQPVGGDQIGQDRRRPEVGEDLRGAVDQGDRQEEGHGEEILGGEQRRRAQQGGADQEGEDLHSTAVGAVHQHAGGDAEQEPRQPGGGADQRDLRGGGGEPDGDQRQEGAEDAVAEVRGAGGGQLRGERAAEGSGGFGRWFGHGARVRGGGPGRCGGRGRHGRLGSLGWWCRGNSAKESMQRYLCT